MTYNSIRTIFLVVIVALMGMQGNAQRFRGGLLAGLTASQVDGDTYSGYKKAGVIAGGWVNIAFNERYSFETELYYIQKGSIHNPKNTETGDTLLKIKLGYVEMPFLLRYTTRSKFYFEAGPSIGLLLHGVTELAPGIPRDNPFRLFEASIHAGLGYKYTEKINIGLRLINSVTPIREQLAPGDRHRFGTYGQFNNLLAMQFIYVF